MNWRKLLLPFSALYWIGTEVRNVLFNAGIFPVKKFKKPIIIIGNLSVGGTGKSPLAMHVLKLLKNEFQVASLSRGYGRKTSGFIVANYDSNAKQIGDEPMQFFNRFKNRIIVSVGEDRVNAVEQLLTKFPLDAIVLDDAYQHRSLDSDFKILLTDYSNRYSKDFLLPAGDLRESSINAKRAKIIVVTKCPDNLSEEEKAKITKELRVKKHQEIIFSKIEYSDTLHHIENDIKLRMVSEFNVLAVTGIANPKPFITFAEQNFANVYNLNYQDHYQFKDSDINQILKSFNEIKGDKLILTTEKDYMRLKNHYKIIDNLYYLPISLSFDNEEKFNQSILNYVRSF